VQGGEGAQFLGSTCASRSGISSSVLAFFHTAAVHVPVFEGIARALAPSIRTQHSVREDLLARAFADGAVTDSTREAAQAEVQSLIGEGARVVLCTCSTLGSAADGTPHAAGVHVLRVDRTMAERAVALEKPILLVAAIPTALETAIALLDEVGLATGVRRAARRDLLCGAAWAYFLAGDHVAYAKALAQQVTQSARPGDVVMLAQASMAPAAALIDRSDIEILTSPETGVRAALSRLG
jgi:hypothetical protein